MDWEIRRRERLRGVEKDYARVVNVIVNW